MKFYFVALSKFPDEKEKWNKYLVGTIINYLYTKISVFVSAVTLFKHMRLLSHYNTLVKGFFLSVDQVA